MIYLPIHSVQSSSILPFSIDTTPSPTSLPVSSDSQSDSNPISIIPIIQPSMLENHYITNNILFWDSIIDIQAPSSQIIFYNVNGLELSSYIAMLESLCNYIY